MGNTLGNLKKKKRIPNPRDIKKRSDYAPAYNKNSIMVGGRREKTDTGYIVPGFAGKSFETYFEHMEPSTSTPVYKHEKKDKVIRVTQGVLYVIHTQENSTVQTRAIPGDEVVLERGKEYKLATSTALAEFFVCQQAKYNAVLETMDESSAVKTSVPDSVLAPPSLEDRITKTVPYLAESKRQGSKAKEQLAAIRKERNKRKPSKKTPKGADEIDFSAMTTELNPRPSMGKLDAEGSG